MKKYKARGDSAVIVEAVQWDNNIDLNEVVGDRYGVDWMYLMKPGPTLIRSGTLNTLTPINYKDWIVKTPENVILIFSPSGFNADFTEL